MENNYRDMMDQVKAPEGLRREVMKMSEQERTKKTRPLPVRVVLVAACVCALLVVVAVAAEVAGFDFVQIFKGTEKDGWDYMVDVSELAGYIPLKDLSPALQELQEQYKDADYHMERLYFDSWEEAEEYIGYEITDNAILAQSIYTARPITDGEEKQNICCARIWIKYGKIYTISVYAYYEMNWPRVYSASPDISVSVDLYIGDESALYGPGMAYLSDDSVAELQENYLTENGSAVVIVNMIDNSDWFPDGGGCYQAHFILRGMLFTVDAHYHGPEDQEIVLAGLKEDLDNFK